VQVVYCSPVAALPAHLSHLRTQPCLPTFVFSADCRSCPNIVRNSAMLQNRFISFTVSVHTLHRPCLLDPRTDNLAGLLSSPKMMTRSQTRLTPPSTRDASPSSRDTTTSSFASTSTVPRPDGMYQRLAGKLAVCSLAELYGFGNEGECGFLLTVLTWKSFQVCSKIRSWSHPRSRSTSERPGQGSLQSSSRRRFPSTRGALFQV
jgi:hypothetical protein